MSDRELRDIVLRSLRRVAPEVDPGEIDPDVPFQEQLDIDSMDFLNFIIGIAEATGVEIPERDYPKVASLNACVAYLAERAVAPKA